MELKKAKVLITGGSLGIGYAAAKILIDAGAKVVICGRQVKVKNSCFMLRHTDKDLSNIAFESGFSDQSHFSREFKRQIGLTPLEYRSVK